MSPWRGGAILALLLHGAALWALLRGSTLPLPTPRPPEPEILVSLASEPAPPLPAVTPTSPPAIPAHTRPAPARPQRTDQASSIHPRQAPPVPQAPSLAKSEAAAPADAAPEPRPAAEPRPAPAEVAAPVTPPRFDAAYLANPAPPYPVMSRRLKEEGRVLLKVRVGPDGSAQEVELAKSSGFARLDEAARNAVAHWRFTPARQGQQAIAAWVNVPLVFRLDGGG